jgi:hypothetical protein
MKKSKTELIIGGKNMAEVDSSKRTKNFEPLTENYEIERKRSLSFTEF